MDENDWIFDFVYQFLESDKFDAAVMDFVDEKCHFFDNDEENKLIYTEIFNEFKDHMESLIASNLNELDIGTDVLYDACQKSRSSRDINKAVFEKMLAMEDFNVFKKIMVKRNVQIQYEAMQSYKFSGADDDNDEEFEAFMNSAHSSNLPNPDELEAMIDAQEDEIDKINDPAALAAYYRDTLLELELLHRQEELEALELEQAVALSILAEEERLKAIRAEAKRSSNDDHAVSESRNTYTGAYASDDKTSSMASPAKASAKEGQARMKPLSSAKADDVDIPDVKPLKGFSLSSKALPPIGGGGGSAPNPVQMNMELNGLKKQAEESYRLNQNQRNQQKKDVETLSKAVPVDAAEVERRAVYMAEQRDKLLAKKKQERDAKVRAEEERLQAAREVVRQNSSSVGSPVRVSKAADSKESESSPNSRNTNDEQEQQRAMMRYALARHMKQGLIESEEAKINKLHEEQYVSLDRKLMEVERVRQENQLRDQVLAENLRRQQAVIARNIQKSAAELRHGS